MKQYQDLLQRILDEGCEKESGRPNMPHVWGIEDGNIKMDLKQGFPLLTTKKMSWKMIVKELLWFLRGETNIKWLVDNDVNIWNGDAYRWYQKKCEDADEPLFFRSIETFIDFIKNAEQFYIETRNSYIEGKGFKSENFMLLHHLEQLNTVNYLIGDLGKVYGYQWRNQNGIDQIKDILDNLQKNPYSRYSILDAWNKRDFPEMALPPCHLLYHFIVRPLSIEDRWDLLQKEEWDKPFNQSSTEDNELHRICDNYSIPKFYLNLNMYQRSCDTFLGVPFNIASMSLLLMIMAKACNMIPKQSNWLGGDVHIYLDHIPIVKEQIEREPFPLPKMIIKKELHTLEDILTLTVDDFELQGYKSHPPLKGELFTGYTK